MWPGDNNGFIAVTPDPASLVGCAFVTGVLE
jgi:hypothetical protein